MKGGVLISMIGCGRNAGTHKCLMRALVTVPREVQFVLTDNASKDGTGDMFERARASFPDRITLFREKENTGFIPPGNRAFHLSVTRGYEFTILLNDDTEPPDGWLEKLLAPFEDPSVALVCPQGTCCSLDHNFHGYQGDAFEYCEGSCLAIRNKAITSFSQTLFDENLTGIYGDDSNLSLRAREQGWQIARANFDMPHIRSATTRAPEVKAFCDFHQKKNHEYNARRWKHYLDYRRMDFPILIRRSYAIGDVLLTTPIIRAIGRSLPLCTVYLETHFPELFARNPYVTEARRSWLGADIWSRRELMVIDLDGAYENRPMTHIVDAYEEVARQHLPGLPPIEYKTVLIPSKEDEKWAKEKREELDGTRPLALIGSEPTTWRGKNWHEERYTDIRRRLEAEGWNTASVGTKKADLKTTIHQLAALMGQAQLFVGNDSFPLHCAQAMGCPVAAPFGPTLPRFIFTQGSKAAAAAADPRIPCAGERHRTSGKTFVGCDASCIGSVTTEHMWQAIKRLGVL